MRDGALLLAVRDVVVRFGGIAALDGVSFDVRDGEIVGLIGPNGAGKTTMFNCISRLYTPTSGSIAFEGRALLGLPAYRMAGLGISRTFQNVALFPTLTVLDNVLVGGHAGSRGDLVGDACRLPGARRGEAALRRAAQAAVDDLGLGDVAHRTVAGLPFGTQKRVELARALMARPRLLLLDEPAGGLNQDEVLAFGGLLRRIRDERGVTMLIVEHHMGLVMSLCDHLVALNFGRKLVEGAPSAVRDDPELVRAYLGEAA